MSVELPSAEGRDIAPDCTPDEWRAEVNRVLVGVRELINARWPSRRANEEDQ